MTTKGFTAAMTSSTLSVGKGLNAEQLSVLKNASPSVDDIFKNMDAFNEELEDSYDITTESKEELVEEEVEVEEEEVIDDMPDLDAELAQLRAQAEAQKQALAAEAAETGQAEEIQELSPSEQLRRQIISMLNGSKDAPSAGKIRAWKKQYGAVYVTAFDDNEVYCYTHLRRGQWNKIQEVIQAAQGTSVGGNLEEELKFKVLQYTILHPRPLPLEFQYNSRAGLIDSLYQAVLLNSYFLAPQQVMTLTTQL